MTGAAHAAAHAALAASATLILYALAGYPAILKALSLRSGHRSRAGEESLAPDSRPDPLPMVTVTVPVFNEEAQIEETLRSLLALDYPRERRQILIVSDGSTDRTDEIVRGFREEGIELLRIEGRRGKSAIENAAHPHLRGEIVVNTDASIRLHPGALRALVAAFADPEVGVASGRDVSVSALEDDPNAGESGYVGYEMGIRALETATGGIVGASGCLYAIRAELHRTPVPPELSRDFSSALIAREHGYRAVSVEEALCHVPRAGSLRHEYPRKVRTAARGLRTLLARRSLMNPFRHGSFAWKLISHKLCRWLVPWAILLAAGALGVLAVEVPWARWALFAGVAGGIAAAIGWLWPEGREAPPLFTIPAYFVVGNVAVLHAWLRTARGRKDAVWEPTRRRSVSTGAELTSPRS